MNISSNSTTANSGGSGLTIQNFKILRTINKGAFAQVYEALDTITNRTMALKIVSLQISDLFDMYLITFSFCQGFSN